MTLSDFGNNSYIIHLVLGRWNLTLLPEVRLLNLRHLDLSHNRLASVDMDTFLVLVSLRELSLANNPLESLWRRGSWQFHSALIHLDLSLTGLTSARL
jgi:Leucine-rich repeat (LRR) protein